MVASGGVFAASHAPALYTLSIPLVQELTANADASAAKVIGNALMADAFIGHAVAARYYRDSYLPQLDAEAELAPTPRGSVFGRIAPAMAALWASAQANRTLTTCLAERSSVTDTVPALSERLEALQVQPRMPPPPRWCSCM